MKNVVVTGATGGIGSAVVKSLSAEFNVMAYPHADLKPHTYADILICCHATPPNSSLVETLAIDVQQAYESYLAVCPSMAENRWGRVIFFSSIRAQQPRPGQVAYATAKAAIEGMTRALAVKDGHYGITVNCIAPGAVDTPRTRTNIAAGIVSEAELISRTPNGRLATTADVVNTVLWLISDEASHVNGQVITVDGGWSVRG